MYIIVDRIRSDEHATLSIVSIDGRFECFGLEDEFRFVKVRGETRIPSGVYPIIIRTEGGFHGNYSRRFSDIHKGMLQIANVPNFEYILIHVGNDEDDTDGCLLLGKNATTVGTPTTPASTPAYKEFYNKVIDEAIKGNVTIEFIDSDR